MLVIDGLENAASVLTVRNIRACKDKISRHFLKLLKQELSTRESAGGMDPVCPVVIKNRNRSEEK